MAKKRALFLYFFNTLLITGIIFSLPAIVKLVPLTLFFSKLGIAFFGLATGSLVLRAIIRLAKSILTHLPKFKFPRWKIKLPSPEIALRVPWLRLAPSFYWKRITFSLRKVRVQDGRQIKFRRKRIKGYLFLVSRADEKTLFYTAVALSVTAFVCLVLFIFTWKRLLLGHNGLDMFDIFGGF